MKLLNILKRNSGSEIYHGSSQQWKMTINISTNTDSGNSFTIFNSETY